MAVDDMIAIGVATTAISFLAGYYAGAHALARRIHREFGLRPPRDLDSGTIIHAFRHDRKRGDDR